MLGMLLWGCGAVVVLMGVLVGARALIALMTDLEVM